MNTLRTHYDNLKVARDAPDFVIRAAYRTLSQNYHPDKQPGDERAARVMSIINQSYEVLSDPERRQEHDAWIAREEARFKQQSQQKSPPISSQQQQPRQAPPPQKARGNLFVGILLWPLKALFAVLVEVPQLGVVVLLMGGIWLWSALTPDRPSPPPRPGPKPYQVEAPAKPTYSRPTTAPNGNPWPTRADLLRDSRSTMMGAAPTSPWTTRATIRTSSSSWFRWRARLRIQSGSSIFRPEHGSP